MTSKDARRPYATRGTQARHVGVEGRGTGAWLALYVALWLGTVNACAPPCALRHARERWYAATGVREPQGTTWEFAYAYRVPCGELSAARPVSRGRFVGCTHGGGREGAHVEVARLDDACAGTTLHEMGHVLGASHHDGEGVMTSNRNDSGYRTCLTADDLSALCWTGRCAWERPECE